MRNRDFPPRCHPGNLNLFEITRASVLYFSENVRANFKFYEGENFSDSSIHRIFEFENFRFPFSVKKSLIRRVKCKKLNLRKW